MNEGEAGRERGRRGVKGSGGGVEGEEEQRGEEEE